MKTLEEMSIGHRIALTVVIVLAILFALALFGYITGRWDEADAQPIPYPTSPYDPITCMPDEETKEKIRAILLEATEEALKQHVVKMHAVWMADARDQPRRATQGTRQGLRAYMSGRAFLLKWNPPLCGG